MKKINTQYGFTLVELMLVTSILAVCILGMVNLYIFLGIQANLSGNKTRAIAEAQSKLEEIRNTDFNDIVSTFTTGCVCGNGADDDGDGQIDYPNDSDCASQSENAESPGVGADLGVCTGSFDLSQLTGKGVIYIYTDHASLSEINPELLGIEIVISWRDKSSRIIGEDKDLDGVLDAGEDSNGDLKLSSPVQIMSEYTKR